MGKTSASRQYNLRQAIEGAKNDPRPCKWVIYNNADDDLEAWVPADWEKNKGFTRRLSDARVFSCYADARTFMSVNGYANDWLAVPLYIMESGIVR